MLLVLLNDVDIAVKMLRQYYNLYKLEVKPDLSLDKSFLFAPSMTAFDYLANKCKDIAKLCGKAVNPMQSALKVLANN